MDAAFYALLGFALTQLAAIGLANLPDRFWRSRPLLAGGR
jgi:multisubunit Na+/H+ antiporter MnhG subunit